MGSALTTAITLSELIGGGVRVAAGRDVVAGAELAPMVGLVAGTLAAGPRS